MKTEEPCNNLKTQAQPDPAKSQSAEAGAGIKIRTGLRAGYLMGFMDMY